MSWQENWKPHGEKLCAELVADFEPAEVRAIIKAVELSLTKDGLSPEGAERAEKLVKELTDEFGRGPAVMIIISAKQEIKRVQKSERESSHPKHFRPSE